MKKCLSLLMSFFMLFTVAYAASGDIAGKIYSTDIKAYINGVAVPSYNIGGKTVVIVEDITNLYSYSDSLRTLLINDLSPENLVAGENSYSQKPGIPVGNIYETDIKTYFRGKELTSYSLDGKMAVVIEELGVDSDVNYSEIGGRYVWDAENRTISLYSLYRYPYRLRNLLSDKNLNMAISESKADGLLYAEFNKSAYNSGNVVYDMEKSDNSIYSVLYIDGNGKQLIGYLCSFAETNFVDGKLSVKQAPVDCFFMDKLEGIIENLQSATLTYQDRMDYFEHQGYVISSEFETDDYHFLYMTLRLPHGSSQALVKVNKADGTVVNYDDEFESVSLDGGVRFENVTIDKENETVRFHYDCDYIIDLKNDSVKAYDLQTDIGVGASDGKPSDYTIQCVANGMFRYTLDVDGKTAAVDGFFTPEYYYSLMFPMDEMFKLLDIKYTFEKDCLTVDTTNAKQFSVENSERISGNVETPDICYLYIDKVVADGEPAEIKYQYSSGHFENMTTGSSKAMPYVLNGKVYVNFDFVKGLTER